MAQKCIIGTNEIDHGPLVTGGFHCKVRVPDSNIYV